MGRCPEPQRIMKYVQYIFDQSPQTNINQNVWLEVEQCGFLNHLSSTREVIHDFIFGHCKFSGMRKENGHTFNHV